MATQTGRVRVFAAFPSSFCADFGGERRVTRVTTSTEHPQERPQKLLKELTCSVSLPDGTDGTCTYERLGPACHRFDFRYGDGALLSRQYLTQPLGNTETVIEATARARANTAFAEAMEHECRDYFARVTEPTDGSRVKDPARYCLDPKKAKEYGGKYALCLPLGAGRLLRVSAVADSSRRSPKRGEAAQMIGLLSPAAVGSTGAGRGCDTIRSTPWDIHASTRCSPKCRDLASDTNVCFFALIQMVQGVLFPSEK